MEQLRLGDGSEVSYRVVGEGFPIIGMPGGPGVSAGYVYSFAEPLLDRLTWYLIDPPGTGASTPSSDYSIGAHAAFYRNVISALGLDQALIFGHSYSGTVATTFAAQYPETTPGCLLVAPPVVGTNVDAAEGGQIRADMNTAMERHAKDPWYEDAVQAEFNPDPTDPAGSFRRGLPLYFSNPTDQLLESAIAAMGPIEINMDPMTWFYQKEWPGLDLRPALISLAMPILAIVGEHDWAVPPNQARYYESAPAGRMLVIPDCGHFVQVEKPAAYRDAVIDWLAETGLD